MNPKPGEIHFVDLRTVGKVRPAVVVSRENPKSPRAISIWVPLTTQLRQSPYEVAVGKLRFLDRPSWANVRAVSAIGYETFLRRLGTSTPKQLEEIRSALRFALELEKPDPHAGMTPSTHSRIPLGRIDSLTLLALILFYGTLFAFFNFVQFETPFCFGISGASLKDAIVNSLSIATLL